VRKLMVAFAIAAVTTLAACKKTGEGEYEVDKPVVGTTKDTVQTPTVDVGTKEDTVVVKTPDVDVKTPAERRRDTARKRP
jgi:hypothetical protein